MKQDRDDEIKWGQEWMEEQMKGDPVMRVLGIILCTIAIYLGLHW